MHVISREAQGKPAAVELRTNVAAPWEQLIETRDSSEIQYLQQQILFDPLADGN